MKRLGTILAGVLMAVTVLAVPATSFAASNAIGVNPRRDYTIKPGEKVSDTIFVSNLNKTDELNLKIEAIDFGPMDETGSPSLMLKQTKPTTWSLKPFLTIPPTVTIAAGKSIDLPFTVQIPANVGAGSYYSAIRYSAVKGASGQNISLTSSTVTLMFVTVPGKTNSNLQLQKFGAFTPSKDNTTGVYASFYGSTKPKYISYLLKNTGNVAEQPKGSLILTNMFGKTVKTISDANPNGNIVLIGQSRRYDVCVNPHPAPNAPGSSQSPGTVCDTPSLWPGKYTAKLGLVYGINGSSQQNINGKATFWYLPAWFIIAVVVGLLLIAGLVWLVYNAIKNGRGNKYRSRR